MAKTKTKSKRPISRKFWSWLQYLPKSLRARWIRSKFQVDLDLPRELTFSQAETPEEIAQALRLVHDSYVELGYIDGNKARLRFSKYHALPTAVILIAKWNDEVIGTLSILPDSAMGLPADTTWSLQKYRSQGKVIAEISSLCIKKDFRMRRGRLLMPLCKAMFEYCRDFLKLDGIVIATTVEVEPFYTDVLLFEKVTEQTGQAHQLVKGNPSTCCYLGINDQLIENYKAVYSGKPTQQDLYNFFMIQTLPQIRLPGKKTCIQSYMSRKNSSQARILREHSHLTQDFTSNERQIIINMDVMKNLDRSGIDRGPNSGRPEPRPEIRTEGWCVFANVKGPVHCRIMDISRQGFKIHLKDEIPAKLEGEIFVLVMKLNDQLIQCKAQVRWTQSQMKVGCQVLETSAGWNELINELWVELGLHSNVIPLHSRKTA